MADLHRKGHPTDKLVEVSRRLRNLEIGTTGRQRKYGEMIVSGAFDITVDYAVGQVVEYEGATYVVSPSAPTPPPAGTLPTDATYWMPVGSQAGEGPEGPQGPVGPMGPPGSGNNWIFRGPWNVATLYASGDVVNHDPADARRTSSYVATRATVGDPPDSSPAESCRIGTSANTWSIAYTEYARPRCSRISSNSREPIEPPSSVE